MIQYMKIQNRIFYVSKLLHGPQKHTARPCESAVAQPLRLSYISGTGLAG
jgi:hypothetical protein